MEESKQLAKLDIKELDSILVMALDCAVDDLDIAVKNYKASIGHYEVVTNLLAVAYERMKSLEK